MAGIFVTFRIIFIFDTFSTFSKMKKTLILFFYTLIVSFIATAQIPKKRLPQNINVPTYSHVFPSLSGDGNQMIYLTDYTNEDGFETRYTYKTGAEVWADPEPIPSINRPSLDHTGSFCLSYDGNFVVFSSRRSPGIGNYDIWISEKNGNRWSQPKNPGKPLNSSGHEGNPSLSPDGKSIYFMRCEAMDNTEKRNCQLYVSHRISAIRWSEPEALPDYINTGHETTPRILADNKTLIFASGRSGGKGKMDLYSTSLNQNTWTKPKSLSFINTDQNDEFITVPARGDIIYFSGTYRDKYNIFKAIIPEEFRAQKVLMLTGMVTYDDGQKPSDDVLIQAFDLSTGEVFTTTKLKKNDDSYTIFLPEGTSYDVSAFPQKGGHTYQSQFFDLSDMLIARKEQLSISLLAIKSGMSMPLSTIRFEDYSAVLRDDSNIEIKRIIGFLKKNPGSRIEIGAFIDQVYSDTIPSNDLTEVIADTVFFQIQKEDDLAINDSLENDFPDREADEVLNNYDTLADTFDSLANVNLAVSDSMPAYPASPAGGRTDMDFEDIETEFETPISPLDSIQALGYELFEETEIFESYMIINYTYHNDRTQMQAEALMNKLIDSGVPANLMEAKGYGDDWLEDRASEERNYWIELKILGAL